MNEPTSAVRLPGAELRRFGHVCGFFHSQEEEYHVLLPLTKEGFRCVSGGTDSHLILVDLRPFEITGKLAQVVLEAVNITTNRNSIPFDPEKPFVTSGVRLGTPAVTTRGMQEPEMAQIAALIARALRAKDNEQEQAAVRKDVVDLCHRFPIHTV